LDGATGHRAATSACTVEFDAVIAPGAQLAVLPAVPRIRMAPNTADNVRMSGLTNTAWTS
jgi:hypothetical protein